MDKYKRRYSDNRISKMCRFCGCEDKENVSIFLTKKSSLSPSSSSSSSLSSSSSSSSAKGGAGSEDLLNKISTVYPFVMYENDPLPQHICPKCIANVSSLYREIQEVLRHQKMLMNLIRSEEPQHEYFRILNEIKISAKSTKICIKASYNVDINQNTPIKLITFPSSETTDLDKAQHQTSANYQAPKPVNEKLVQNIQTKLEQNGFTIKRIKVGQFENKSEPVAVDETVPCSYCKETFPSEKELALHQVTHMKVSTDKIFEKRLLPKNWRRGRLICVNNEKNIRCLNCWQVFKDNKSILQHWSCSDCYYYCFICGHEFPHSPKLLREHMPTVHGVSFRSTMKQFFVCRTAPTPVKVSLAQSSLPGKLLPLHVMKPARPAKLIVSPRKKKNYYRQGKSSTKNADGTFSCNICQKVFNNYRSSNSHMRIHNLPEVYTNTKKDSYSSNDELLLPDITPTGIIQSAPTPVPVAFSTTLPNFLHPVRPPYKIITNNGPLRGIRTKIVQKRTDFIANNGGGNGGLNINTIETVSSSTSSLWGPKGGPPPQHYEWPHPGGETSARIADDSTLMFNRPHVPQTIIKPEPLELLNSAPDYSQWTCFICKDTFANSKEYEMHAMFVHNINN